MRTTTITLSCALLLASSGANAEPSPHAVGFFGKMQQRLQLRRSLQRAGVDRASRSLLTAKSDGGAPGMRGMLAQVRSLALDRSLWRKTRFVASSAGEGANSLQLFDVKRQLIGRIDVVRSPAGSREVRVADGINKTSASYRIQADRGRGELEVQAALNGPGTHLERTERSFLRSLHWTGPTYRMNFGWLTVGDAPRVGYRHRDGQRLAEWPAPLRTP